MIANCESSTKRIKKSLDKQKTKNSISHVLLTRSVVILLLIIFLLISSSQTSKPMLLFFILLLNDFLSFIFSCLFDFFFFSFFFLISFLILPIPIFHPVSDKILTTCAIPSFFCPQDPVSQAWVAVSMTVSIFAKLTFQQVLKIVIPPANVARFFIRSFKLFVESCIFNLNSLAV